MEAWGNFARVGEPGNATAPWPRYTPADERRFIFDLRPGVETRATNDNCDLWDGLER